MLGGMCLALVFFFFFNNLTGFIFSQCEITIALEEPRTRSEWKKSERSRGFSFTWLSKEKKY